MQPPRLQLRSSLLSQSSSGALFYRKVAPAPSSDSGSKVLDRMMPIGKYGTYETLGPMKQSNFFRMARSYSRDISVWELVTHDAVTIVIWAFSDRRLGLGLDGSDFGGQK